MENNKRLWTLFTGVLRISACTFGGGYVIVPLMKKRFAEELHWISEEEMLDIVALSQSSPGPIAVNAALMLGYRLGGLKAALVALLGTVLPPLVIIAAVSYFYEAFRANTYVAAALKGMQAGVAALIVNAVIDLGKGVLSKGDKTFSLCVMLAAFLSVFWLNVNVILVVLLSGAAGYLYKKIQGRARQ